MRVCVPLGALLDESIDALSGVVDDLEFFDETKAVGPTNGTLAPLPCAMVFDRVHVTCEGYLTACCVDYENNLITLTRNEVSSIEFLKQSEDDSAGGSAALRRAVIAQTTAETESLRFSEVLEKGPAVRATRAQADRALYKAAIRSMLENQANLDIFQQAVDDLVVEGDRVSGVVTQMGLRFRAPAVVLTVGTFLGGRIHIGLENYQGGRAGAHGDSPHARDRRPVGRGRHPQQADETRRGADRGPRPAPGRAPPSPRRRCFPFGPGRG